MIIMGVVSKREDVMEPKPLVSADGIPEEDNVEESWKSFISFCL